jgi:hypothetical protein
VRERLPVCSKYFPIALPIPEGIPLAYLPIDVVEDLVETFTVTVEQRTAYLLSFASDKLKQRFIAFLTDSNLDVKIGSSKLKKGIEERIGFYSNCNDRKLTNDEATNNFAKQRLSRDQSVANMFRIRARCFESQHASHHLDDARGDIHFSGEKRNNSCVTNPSKKISSKMSLSVIGEKLGSGNVGQVYHGTCTVNGKKKEAAIKVALMGGSSTNPNLRSRFLDCERRLMRAIQEAGFTRMPEVTMKKIFLLSKRRSRWNCSMEV